jgi:hypothetical protein
MAAKGNEAFFRQQSSASIFYEQIAYTFLFQTKLILFNIDRSIRGRS